MKLRELVEHLDLQIWTHPERADVEVSGGYVGDLLSDVIANSRTGNVWVTIQIHPNIVAVAVLKELTAVVVANDRRPQEDTLKKAEAEGVILATSPLSGYELAGRIYELCASRVGG